MTSLGKAVPIVVLALLFAVAACNNDMPAADTDATALRAEDRESIEALSDAYVDLAMAGDWDAFADLWHADAVRIEPGMPNWEGREAIREAFEAADLAGVLAEFSTVEVGGTRELAYIWSTYDVEWTEEENGEEVTVQDEGSWLAIVRPDEDGTWRLYRFIYHSDL